jgi:Acyl-CoA reductase (LuxC)
MTLTEKKNILSRLGVILKQLGNDKAWSGYELGINSEEYQAFNDLIKSVHIYNGWFKEEQVRKSLRGISAWLDEKELDNWLSSYEIKESARGNVAIIMAGNIPLVGFHDLIAVFLSGHQAMVKLSSDDQHLLPAVLKLMSLFDERIESLIQINEEKMEGFNAVIATGSDNSSRYFESYFGKYPNIIRKNRTSIAVLNGTESAEELFNLGNDIFDYYGLGCRNVSQIWIPENYELDTFFEGVFKHSEVIHHHKYANNYDYNKAILLMNQDSILDNGFLLLKEDKSLHSPLAVIHYQRYQEVSEVNNFIDENKENIQVVIGKDYFSFGKSQMPKLNDYADGVDTMEFLCKL